MVHYVYFIIPQNRLVITKEPIDKEDYYSLFKATGLESREVCNAFCVGFIRRGEIDRRSDCVVNTTEEFE
jgi:hypothetical protein